MPKYKNRILSSLPKSKLDLLTPHLTKVSLAQRQVVYDVGDTIQQIYFIETGAASVLTMMSNGATIEVGMIGFEGFAGIPVILGETVSNQHIVIQIDATAYRINAAICKELFESDPALRKSMLRFIEVFLNLSSQTAACNRLHMVEQRCARWLLLSSDHTQSDSLPLTQEYLASMIGVRRSGISEAAGGLQRAGLIIYNQGNITIVDRPGLEKCACECYQLDRERFDQLINN